MDKASDFGSEDCRFESCHDQISIFPFLVLKKKVKVFIEPVHSRVDFHLTVSVIVHRKCSKSKKINPNFTE